MRKKIAVLKKMWYVRIIYVDKQKKNILKKLDIN